MIALDRTLVGREQPAVEQAGDAIDAGEHFMGKPTGCDVALVAVGTRKGALVGLPAESPQARLDVCGQNRREQLRGRVGESRQTATPEVFRLPALNSDANQGLLAGRASAFASGAHAAEQRLVHLDDPAEPVSTESDHRLVQTVQHRPRRLVRTQCEHPPEGREPNKARSIRRRRSKMEGKKLPVRSFGMPTSMSPAAVVTSFGRCPLRWAVRLSVRWPDAALIAAVSSASISCWSTQARLRRTVSVISPA